MERKCLRDKYRFRDMFKVLAQLQFRFFKNKMKIRLLNRIEKDEIKQYIQYPQNGSSTDVSF